MQLTHKFFFYAVQKVYGIKCYRAKLLCNILGLNPKFFPLQKFSNDLSFCSEMLLEKLNFLLQDELLFKVKTDIRNLRKIRSYRGIRHTKRLPARGQRTHTNAKTNKRINKVLKF